jgi:adenylate kinase family enzyme
MDRGSLGRRIDVVGTTGSGKTTMAGRLAERLGLPHVELDALYWGPDWTPVSLELFRQRIVEALSDDAWVVDGNYGMVRDLVWPRIDTVVWLDYSLAVIMARLLWRTIGRSVTGQELWHGNRESLRTSFFSRDSILLWGLQTYRRRRRNYTSLLGQPEHAHLAVVHLRSPRAARVWLATVGSGPARLSM